MKILLPGSNFNDHVILFVCICEVIKGALSGLRKFLANDSPLTMMENAFYYTLKALFVLSIFLFLFWPFDHDHVKKRLD